MEHEELSVDTNLSEYGVDSIGITVLTDEINKYYDIALTPAVFYGYPHIQALSHYLVAEFPEAIINKHKEESHFLPVDIESKSDDKPALSEPISSKRDLTQLDNEVSYQPIAIIGMDGMFPQSNDLEDFWRHLENQDDLITEIPIERWDWRRYYSDATLAAVENKLQVGRIP